MNHPTAYELLDRFNEIERGRQMGKSVAEKIIGEKDKNDALTISYMMGEESANDTIRALKKRIEEFKTVITELEAQVDTIGDAKARIAHLEAQVEEYKMHNGEMWLWTLGKPVRPLRGDEIFLRKENP